VLAKVDLDIAARYAALARSRAAIWPRLEKEHALTVRWVLDLLKSERLLDGNPTMQG
jgi:phosphoenolpyruvate carboxylase